MVKISTFEIARAFSLSHMGLGIHCSGRELRDWCMRVKVKKRDADCSIGHRARQSVTCTHIYTFPLCVAWECTKRPALRVIHFPQKLRSSPLIAVSAAVAAAMPQGNISSQHTLHVNIAAWGRVDAEWLHVPLCAVVCVFACAEGGRGRNIYCIFAHHPNFNNRLIDTFKMTPIRGVVVNVFLFLVNVTTDVP